MTQEAKHEQTAARHTPGPWEIRADPDNAGKHPFHDRRYITTKGFQFDGNNWDNPDAAIICEMRDHFTDANHRLIASAPDLLTERDALKQEKAELVEVLRFFVQRIDQLMQTNGWRKQDESGFDGGTWVGPIVLTPYDKARALLAKIDAQHTTNTEGGM